MKDEQEQGNLYDNSPNKVHFISLEKENIHDIVSAFKNIGWNKPASIYESYLLDESAGKRSIILAYHGRIFIGYVTIKWLSDYPNFQKHNIPEISDLNVLPAYRKAGIGTSLIKWCEESALKNGLATVGIGVGMTADYGAAQRLYVQLGYIPDGKGLHENNHPVIYGKNALVDDDLVLFLTKKMSESNEPSFSR